MKTKHFTSIVSTSQLEALKIFYTRHLGFHVTFEHENYLGLKAGETELGFMKGECNQEFDGKGLTYCFVVENADRAYEELRSAGVSFIEPPTDRPWGDRAAIATDPIGIAIYIAQPIEPTSEYKQCIKE